MNNNDKFKQKSHELIDSLVNQIKELERIVNNVEPETPSEDNSVKAENPKK